jgi:hypothetical protein
VPQSQCTAPESARSKNIVAQKGQQGGRDPLISSGGYIQTIHFTCFASTTASQTFWGLDCVIRLCNTLATCCDSRPKPSWNNTMDRTDSLKPRIGRSQPFCIQKQKNSPLPRLARLWTPLWHRGPATVQQIDFLNQFYGMVQRHQPCQGEDPLVQEVYRMLFPNRCRRHPQLPFRQRQAATFH